MLERWVQEEIWSVSEYVEIPNLKLSRYRQTKSDSDFNKGWSWLSGVNVRLEYSNPSEVNGGDS